MAEFVTSDLKIPDIDGDGIVGFADFLVLSSKFGETVATDSSVDLDKDGTIGFSGFLILSSAFGQRI